jgi:dienelactone hydrolase
MPDFFEGKPADISWYPPDNKDKEQKLGEFFKTQAAPPKTLPRVPKIVEELGKSKGVESWGVVGFCWGGKVCLRVLLYEKLKRRWIDGRLLSCLLITDLDVASG